MTRLQTQPHGRGRAQKIVGLAEDDDSEKFKTGTALEEFVGRDFATLPGTSAPRISSKPDSPKPGAPGRPRRR